MGKSKFHVFAENLRIYLSLRNDFKRCIQLYNCMIKLLHIFRVGKFSIEFEEDTKIRQKYLKKSEILKELSTIGNEGKELATILKVIET